jgi:K(+)-stimulated pyrophosphate-energized sodium pump
LAQKTIYRFIWGAVALLMIGASIFADRLGLPDVRWIIIIACIFLLVFAAYLLTRMLKLDQGTPEMQELSGYIQDGAQTFLKREYQILVIFTLVLGLLLALFINPRPWVSLSFVLGTFVSALASWIGMSVAVRANVRTANAARDHWSAAFGVAFSSGTITSFFLVGFGLLSLTLLTMVFGDSPYVWLGFVFGATTVALFLRVGGGIFTKSADIGADLVGKVEVGIPEDDPRNPATIADNVGDNVGDIAGMGSDLYESYVSALVAAMVLGKITLGEVGVIIPLLIGAIGLLSSMIGSLFVRSPIVAGASYEEQIRKVHRTMNTGIYISNIILVIGAYFMLIHFLAADGLSIFWCMLIGLATGFIIGPVTEYYTSEHRPVIEMADSSQKGPAILVIQGLAVSNMSTVIPIIVIAIATVASYYFAGLLGIAIASVGMMANLGMLLSMDCYGPVTDNAAGIAEMAKLDQEVRENCEMLDAVGNTTAALAKGFAIASAALAALAWLATYFETVNITIASITDPQVVAGLFIGAMLVYLFSALTIKGVSKGAFAVVDEVRKQFAEISGLLEGKVKPNYVRVVDIATIHALQSMLLPGILTIIIPLALGLILNPEAVAGLLMGSLLVGLPMAIQMANAGGAWDNAKKHIEAGNFGGKGSVAHKASVIGDTIGDPLKDTVGPSLDILIKLVGKMAVIFAPLFTIFVLTI